MQYDNPFDRALKSRNIPEPFLTAAVSVTDTLDLSWLAAQSVFGDAAEPEHAIAIAELMFKRLGPQAMP